MHKNKAAEAATPTVSSSSGAGGDGANVNTEGSSSDASNGSSSSFTMLKGLQAAPELTRERDRAERDREMMVERELRDPFADEEEEDGCGSGSGSDGESGGIQGGRGSGGSGWHRGSWWRGVVRSARRGGGRQDEGRTTEKFGDGRDDSDSEGDGDEIMDDEEFGDFAMPEVGGSAGDISPNQTSGSGSAGERTNVGSGATDIDPTREKVLVKPLPLHPAANKTSASPFGSLWPFSTQGFGMSGKEKETSSSKEAPASNEPEITEEPLELEAGEGVLDEDGKRIDRAIEAKRRTSIEDPDEDDVDVGEEIIVGRGGLG
jgi:SIT4-associating protein SAP185/190